MRVALLVASLIAVSTVAGCFGGGGDDDHDHLTYTCTGGKVIDAEDYADHENLTLDDLMAKCPGSTTTRTTTTSTPSAPNVLPTVSLKVMDDGGNETLVTLVDGNLTFDASNSTDSDGNITGVAVSVTDANQTRTASLFDPVSKTFKTATFKFDRPGVVNVTLAVVDDRAGFVTNVSNVYVNEMVNTPANAIQSPQADLAGNSPMHDPCTGAEGPLGSSHTIADANYYQTVTIPVQANATFIVATSTEDVVMTICSPDGTPVSPELVDGTVTSDQPLPLPADATKNYQLAFYATLVPATTAAVVVVHYEPVPVAAA